MRVLRKREEGGVGVGVGRGERGGERCGGWVLRNEVMMVGMALIRIDSDRVVKTGGGSVACWKMKSWGLVAAERGPPQERMSAKETESEIWVSADLRALEGKR